ncbi:UNVERIFIED_ORG: LOW QUALITY PROTEIN: hypothetical protein FHU06_2809 [Citrobacter freundii]
MTEAELLGMIRRAGGIKQPSGKHEATPTAENYARVVAEVMRRDGIELNGQDRLVIRTRVLAMLTTRRRQEQRRSSAPYQWKKPERLRR